MGYRPIVSIIPCPCCGRQPKVKSLWLRGSQMRCKCGVSGPIAVNSYNEADARREWGDVFGRKAIKPPAGSTAPKPPPHPPTGSAPRTATGGG